MQFQPFLPSWAVGLGAVGLSLRPGSVSHSIRAACERAEVKRVRFHDLRHTHATHLLAAGANLKAVSARQGHSSPAFTVQVYGHVMPGIDEQLADMTEVLFDADSIKILSRNGRYHVSGEVGTPV